VPLRRHARDGRARRGGRSAGAARALQSDAAAAARRRGAAADLNLIGFSSATVLHRQRALPAAGRWALAKPCVAASRQQVPARAKHAPQPAVGKPAYPLLRTWRTAPAACWPPAHPARPASAGVARQGAKAPAPQQPCGQERPRLYGNKTRGSCGDDGKEKHDARSVCHVSCYTRSAVSCSTPGDSHRPAVPDAPPGVLALRRSVRRSVREEQ